MKKLLYTIAALFLLTSCEDVIQVEVDEGTIQLAVDAFLNSKAEDQKIILLETKQFFDDVSQKAVEADSVWVIDDLNNRYDFVDGNGDGTYIWSDSVLVHENRTYYLTVARDGVFYTAESKANPVPVIDSINWEYIPKGIGEDNGTYAPELVARDLIGQTDYYWIKSAKNGEYKTGRDAINLSVDGSFSEESMADGNLFIPPISTFPGINLEDSLGIGDEFTYEIWGITEGTIEFWREVSNQTVGGGIGALFATPTANVRTNVQSTSEALNETAVGWFSTSMVSSKTQLIFEKPGEKLSFNIN
jgi:hypothetical protein